jgi:hypothetical protein
MTQDLVEVALNACWLIPFAVICLITLFVQVRDRS